LRPEEAKQNNLVRGSSVYPHSQLLKRKKRTLFDWHTFVGNRHLVLVCNILCCREEFSNFRSLRISVFW